MRYISDPHKISSDKVEGKISVIIPCHNSENYIVRCLESVLSQTIGLEHLEILIVNDYSTDGTLSIVSDYEKRYPDNIGIINLDENVGMGEARNIGLTYASGDYITFLDSDDAISKDMLKALYFPAKQFQCDYADCQFEPFYGDAPITTYSGDAEQYLDVIETLDERKAFFLNNAFINAPWMRLFSREFLIDDMDLRFPAGKRMEDIYFFYLVVAKAKKVYHVPEKLYFYFQNPDGIMLSERFNSYYMDIHYVFAMAVEKFDEMGLKDKLREELAYVYYNKVFKYLVDYTEKEFGEVDKDNYEIMSNYFAELNNDNASEEKKKTIYILCPARRVTGGIELAHQMCYVINKFTDVKALMWYTDIDDTSTETILLDIPAPEEYEIYETEHVSDFAEIDIEENVVIFPEGLTAWLPLIDNAQKVLWWMSVDNYVVVTNGEDLKFISETVDLHLFQSYYSKAFVEQNIPGAKGLFVSDYINDDYRSCDWNAEDKRDIAVYNPKKGFKDLQPIIEKADWLNWIPLQNMDRKQMKETMLQSKIYVDFGYHPGKDRIPREAAACGCCVITNKKGAAAFSGDVPIPDQYKFKDTADHVEEINNLLHDICDHFEDHARNFDAYREMIKSEKDKFIVDVIGFVNQTFHQS